MKKLLILSTTILTSSCELKYEYSNEAEQIKSEYKIKKIKLDYLKELYSIREYISLEQQRKTIDSLINQVKNL